MKIEQKTLNELHNFLLNQDFQFHVTANFNRHTSFRTGRDKLKVWSSFVERDLFGRIYYKKPVNERMFFAAIPESGLISENLHYHMLLKLPEHKHDRFHKIAEGIWKNKVSAGSLYIQQINPTDKDRERVTAYDLKEANSPDKFNNIIFSNEFHR